MGVKAGHGDEFLAGLDGALGGGALEGFGLEGLGDVGEALGGLGEDGGVLTVGWKKEDRLAKSTYRS
jgi:hypothetical protein